LLVFRDKVENYRELDYLDLEYNELTSVQSTFHNTKSLRELHLSFNNITSIDENAFGKNPSLKELYLNNLDGLSVITDGAFCGLTRLEVRTLKIVAYLYLLFSIFF
jgi:Leucine-rich repeat (LRR) protein